jgi:hypothetical protein
LTGVTTIKKEAVWRWLYSLGGTMIMEGSGTASTEEGEIVLEQF